MTPKLIYVAGPYRGATVWEREANIHRARALGVEVVRAGAYPVIPHSNTAHFDGLAPDELFLAGALELMRRCDSSIFTPDWERSTGAREERIEGARIAVGRPHHRFDDPRMLREWLEAEKERDRG